MKFTQEQSILASLRKQVPPDGLFDSEWLKLKDHFVEGDEIWYFRTPQETWAEFVPRCGLEGYALVRGEQVVEMILLSNS